MTESGTPIKMTKKHLAVVSDAEFNAGRSNEAAWREIVANICSQLPGGTHALIPLRLTALADTLADAAERVVEFTRMAKEEDALVISTDDFADLGEAWRAYRSRSISDTEAPKEDAITRCSRCGYEARLPEHTVCPDCDYRRPFQGHMEKITAPRPAYDAREANQLDLPEHQRDRSDIAVPVSEPENPSGDHATAYKRLAKALDEQSDYIVRQSKNIGAVHGELFEKEREIARLTAENAAMREDKERLDWLDSREHFYCITPATNRVGVAQGWTFSRKPLDFLNYRIGERCADIREAIDAARAVSDTEASSGS